MGPRPTVADVNNVQTWKEWEDIAEFPATERDGVITEQAEDFLSPRLLPTPFYIYFRRLGEGLTLSRSWRYHYEWDLTNLGYKRQDAYYIPDRDLDLKSPMFYCVQCRNGTWRLWIHDLGTNEF
jgi:hypothetical protein